MLKDKENFVFAQPHQFRRLVNFSFEFDNLYGQSIIKGRSDNDAVNVQVSYCFMHEYHHFNGLFAGFK